MRDNRTVGEIANMSDMELERLTSPLTEFDYVRVADIGVDYVSGSEGQVKTIVEYSDLNKTYVVSTTIFKYKHADLPTKVSSIEVN